MYVKLQPRVIFVVILYICVCVTLGLTAQLNQGRKVRSDYYPFCHYPLSIQRAHWTLKQNPVKFLTTPKLLTKKPNHPDHINQTRNCANPWLLCRQIQDAVVPKETSKFSKRSSMIFCRFSRKKSLGSVLFSRDFFGLIKMC